MTDTRTPAMTPSRLSTEGTGLVAETTMSRRIFTTTAVAAGFAAAALPVQADTLVTTPADGLVAGPVSIPVGIPVAGGALPGYRAKPEGKGPFPVILVVQEIFGVHEHIKDVCRRFAREGFLAVAPELYARQGDPTTAPDVRTLIDTIVAKVPDAQVMADLDATAAWAATDGGDAKRLGVTGFCWGGRVTWLYATHNPGVTAGVAWYGRLATPANPVQDMVPVERAALLKAPVLGLYGAADQGIPVADVDRMRAALAAAGRTESEIVLYPEGPHGFFADYRPSYRPDMAADGWRRCLDWFRRHGVG